MTTYTSKINSKTFYTLVIRTDRDGQENVVSGFGKHYASMKSAERGAAKFIAKL